MAKTTCRLLGKALVALVCAALLLHSGTVSAAGRGIPVTSGSINGSNARITFQWEQLGNFTATLNDKNLNITFDRTVNPDVGALLGQLYPYVTSAKRSADGKSIAFTMDEPYRIRMFKNGNINGIELLNIDPAKQRSRSKAAAKKPEAKTEAKAVEAKPTEPKAAESKAKEALTAKDKVSESAKAISRSAPAAGETEAPEPKTEQKPEEKAEPKVKAIPVVTAPAAETKKEEPKKEEPKPADKAPEEKAEAKPAAPAIPPSEEVPAETKAEPKPAKVAEEKKAEVPAETKAEPKPAKVAEEKKAEVPAKPEAKPTEEVKKEAPKEASKTGSDKLKLGVSAAEDSATLRFPFDERTAAAVFIRSGTLWIVFNKAIAIDLSDFSSLPETVIGKAEMRMESGVTAIRIPVSSTVLPTIAKEAGKYEWAVLLTPKNRLLSNALSVEVKTDPPAPPHVFIPVLEMASTIELKDPQVGDTLVVTPLFNLGEGMLRARDFIEFTLLETAQGIVVSKKADEVKVIQLRNGVRISPSQGVTLTPGLPPVSENTKPTSLSQSSATLFPDESWKLPEGRERKLFIAELLNQIVGSKDQDEILRARARLAQLYLSEGLAPEAIAQLELIARNGVVFYRSSKMAALHGAANFMMARYAEAARDFSAAELNNNVEVDYWRSMTADLLGNPEPYDYLAINENYISKYPDKMRQKIAIVAADRAVENKEYNTALKIFDTLKQGNSLEPIQDYANYLLAVISSATGQEEEAIKMWDILAENYKSPFVQARAELSRVLWGMERGTINKDQAIERLERLRLAWHGDNLELKVLSLLGNLYSERKDYANSMRVWDGAVSSFPNTAVAVEMERKLEDAFVSLFDEGAAGRMQPLDVLTLYYQYRTHAPGGNVGNQLVSLLADKLVAVDLLDEGAALLDKKMRETEKDQRSEIGAKLAAAHLLNNHPQKALMALQDSVYGDVPQPLVLWRNRLLAQSLSELGKHERALQIVQGDLSPDAETIRLGVYWQRRDWGKIIESAEAVLKVRKHVGKQLSLDESDAVIKLALAYIFEDNKVQLQYLRDYFKPLMASNPYKPLFEYITAKDVVLTPTNFDEMMGSVSQTRSFLDGYRARIRTAGLGTVTGIPIPENVKSQ